MDVVENEYEPRWPAQLVQQCRNGIEQPPALGVRLGLGRADRRWEMLAELREQSGQGRAAVPGQPGHPLAFEVVEGVTDGLHPGLERDDALLVTPAIEGGQALQCREAGRGDRQARLADPRITGDEHHRPALPGGMAADLVDPVQHVVASDQNRLRPTDWRGSGERRAGCRRRVFGRSLRADLGDQLNGLRIRAEPEFSMQPLGERGGGIEGAGPVAGPCQQPDQLAAGRFGQRVQLHAAPGEPDRLRQGAGGGGPPGQLVEHLQHRALVVVAERIDPLVVDVGQHRAAHQVEGPA